MVIPKFVQIHYMIPLTAVSVNQGDDGQPKRIHQGGFLRGRISSQHQKRLWAEHDGRYALYDIDGAVEDYRSREIISGKVMPAVAAAGGFQKEVLEAVEKEMNIGLYGKNGHEWKNRQALLLSLPEVEYLTLIAAEACGEGTNPDRSEEENAEAAGAAARERFLAERANFMVMREGAEIRLGLRVAMNGRMVTSFTDANVDAAIHVSHLITVHAEESEVDHFSTVDDLLPDGQGQAAYLGNTQINSGIYYGYVVVDVPALVQNLEAVPRRKWLETDRKMTGELIHNLIMTIDTVVAGAKKGSTAPYGETAMMMVEVGDRQPRSLAEAFRKPVRSAQVGDAVQALADRVGQSDEAHGKFVVRRHFLMGEDVEIPGSQRLRGSLGLAQWARDAVQRDSLEEE